MKNLCLVVFMLLIIPTGISWRVWLSMFPELNAIAICESQLNPSAIGDHGKSVGIFQINLPSHPAITREQAKDPWFSLSWAIEKFYAGELNIWTCHKILTKNNGLALEL